jgi:hypothetical protein
VDRCQQCVKYEGILDDLRRATFPLAGSIDILTLAVPRMIEAGQAIRSALVKANAVTEEPLCSEPEP